MIARLDHFILEVPDIAAAHADWQSRGFSEAWPVGPFWPKALTSGIALGGVNLELVQPLEREPKTTHTLVFEPKSVAEGFAAMLREGLRPKLAPKVEPDPDLLALRGFPPEMQSEPQRICTNVVPAPGAPLDFFLCEYAPFLRKKLVQPLEILSVEISLPANAVRLLRKLGGCPLLKVVEDGPQRVLAFVTGAGRFDVS
ncbi:hypothetical protein BH11ARM2_BH11ARM2_07130 [soil metagenome]